jgi:formyltetrahydrofolate deformylase
MTARLLIRCPDQPGIIANVTHFLFGLGANVTNLDQHSNGERFFMRLEFDESQLRCSPAELDQCFAVEVARRYGMGWHFSHSEQRPKVAILVSKYDHALLELLWKHARGELPCTITQVISNHVDLQKAVENFGLPYKHTQGLNKTEAEAQILAWLDTENRATDLVVLARYMQILSPEFVAHYPQRIINIHHSFLPAFAGANPYKQAFDKGVKIIGATAHYVTSELDEGPIIDQAVARVSHRFEVQDMLRLGRDLERQVLARAVQWHLEDRIMIDGHRSVVFD